MTAERKEAYAAFLKEKQQIKKTLAANIAEKLEEMGTDIQGLSWFPSSSRKYWAERSKIAA